MLYVHTIGRIGKDCQVITGAHGSFIAFDIAVDDYSHGNSVTTWVRVRSKKENHIRLSEYLTKGRLVLIEGRLRCGKTRTRTTKSSSPLRRTRWSLSIPENGREQLPRRAIRRIQQAMFPYLLPMHHRTTRMTCRSDKGHTRLINNRY